MVLGKKGNCVVVQVSIRLATPLDLSSILEVNKWSTPGVAALAVREVEDMLAASPYCRVATVACPKKIGGGDPGIHLARSAR
jgi:hypothetical protein